MAITKKRRPHSDTHLWDEAAACHCVEAELGHTLGLGTFGSTACQQKSVVGTRPQENDLQTWLQAYKWPRHWSSESSLHMEVSNQHVDSLGLFYPRPMDRLWDGLVRSQLNSFISFVKIT